MATALSICNTAIARIGSLSVISSLSENTAEAIGCALHYPSSLEVMLASFHWRFATKRAVLALVSTGEDADREDWGYIYALPVDCVEVRSIWVGARNPPVSSRAAFDFELAESGSGRVLLCDVEDAQISYTKKFNNTDTVPALFADALAWLVASELALSVAKKPDMANAFAKLHVSTLNRAKAHELNERHEPEPEPESLTARR